VNLYCAQTRQSALSSRVSRAGNGGTRPHTKGRWTPFGNIGRLKLMIESADERVENVSMSRIPRSGGT
jgi:hypothetical protein